jgi:hypothetical protein
MHIQKLYISINIPWGNMVHRIIHTAKGTKFTRHVLPKQSQVSHKHCRSFFESRASSKDYVVSAQKHSLNPSRRWQKYTVTKFKINMQHRNFLPSNWFHTSKKGHLMIANFVSWIFPHPFFWVYQIHMLVIF